MSTTRRVLAALLLAASIGGAQDLLTATGESLAAFDVSADLARVDHSSPEALAESFARLQRDEQAIRRRFARHFRHAHLAILREFYDAGLVAKQQTAYDTTRDGIYDYANAVGEVAVEGDAGATALLRRSWREPSGQPVERTMRLVMERRGDFWWVVRVEHQNEEDEGFVAAGLGAPPEFAPVTIPAAAKPDCSTPEATVRSIHAACTRLAMQRERARQALYRHFFKIVAAFYGPEGEERARAERPPAPPSAALTVQFAAPESRLAGIMRIEATVLEAVPGEKEVTSPVGQAGFDLRRDPDGGWRVAGELSRPAPKEPLLPRSESFALFLVAIG